MPVIESLEPLRSALAAIGQDHLLAFHDRLSPDQRAALLAEIQSVDLAGIPALVREYVHKRPGVAEGLRIEPAPCYSRQQGGLDVRSYFERGVQLVRAGRVAAFTVAGGQGSRLGFDGPKGCFPGGSVTGKPLFACLAEWILAAQRRWCGPGVTIPWAIMTSPQNHAATVEFFRGNAFFGLAERDVLFFPQGVMPALDLASGRMLLADHHQLALAPDGHGGSIKALKVSGALDELRRRGVEHLSYTQIDNPLVRVIDPLFIGLHAAAPDSSGEMSSKMVPKAHAAEKVGVLCLVNGKTAVIEYSDLPQELATRTDASGRLVFNAGSIAIHMLGVEFLERLNSAGSGVAMPYHRAEKKIPHVDLATGARVEPTTPNAVKLETFVFDALPLARASIVLETDRVEEFAPIKNATGVDSVESCRQIQTARACRWLERAGVKIPYAADGRPDCVVELSPLTAMYPEDLKGPGAPPLPFAISDGGRLAL